MAIFEATEDQSHKSGIRQSQIFKDLASNEIYSNDLYAIEKQDLENIDTSEKTGMVASIENASAFCDEEISLRQGFNNLEEIISNVGKVFYIGFTHHAENRFGGGNYSTAGLKSNGKALIDYMAGKNIAIDFSHTCDALAEGILNYLSKQNLDIPIIASHSNYRPVWDHPRNLPDDIAKEIIKKGGLIGLNFLRAFVNNDDPEALYHHVAHGLELGGEDSVCFGADFFNPSNPDPSRIPYYYSEHENASRYPEINAELEKRFGGEVCDKLSHKNALRFLGNLWS